MRYHTGHLDPGEDFRQAALRETEEEAGLGADHLNILDFQRKLEYHTNRGQKEVVYWLAELKDINTKVRLSDEHQAYRWLKLDEAKAIAGYKDMQETLMIVEKYLKQ
ncbi:bis(5'-nucleosyl)-tetraphosphatase [asymmetrical]-like [Amphiura filiformis]|uniref:bis(5'-nucleosyl)-tetraphosphatase [asymmetrical]-like n=1 Tax=Amphiura filiformis TaxID=82378 RepID=UPI003B211E7A